MSFHLCDRNKIIAARTVLLTAVMVFGIDVRLNAPFGGVSDAANGRAHTDGTAPGVASSPARIVVDFDGGWLFSRGDFANAALPAFNDSGWRRLRLPHDWSIEGPFSADYGSGNGYAPGGFGWYRKHFRLDTDDRGKIVSIDFDGVYDYAEVWINGQFVGGRPYGYSSFACILTPHVRFGSDDNVLAVRVDHSRFADSRWYTGSGIYRHVHLCITNPLHIGHWGTYVTTPRVEEDAAVVRVETTVVNESGGGRPFVVESGVIAADGQMTASLATPGRLEAGESKTLVQEISVARPKRWSVDSPALYTLRSRLAADSTVVDETSTPFGIRTIRFDADKGFLLNGRQVKLKGVCVHHDAGCLGAAVPEKVWERRLHALNELGVNAIRTSHNPPAPELLDLCDRLGLLVKDEAFDEFTPPKNKWVSGWNAGVPSRFGYGEVFAEWSVTDIQDMVRRDRNHPCVIMWSVGNEIDYPDDPFSHPVLDKNYRPENPPADNLTKYAKPLIEAVKKLDGTRPVTAALASLAMSDAVGLPALLDIVGYNYQESRYLEDHKRYPNRVIFGSENSHQFSNWAVVRDNDYVSGQFLWTGIDYLGEARAFPNRANGAGLLDLCGFKKPIAYFRQSLWSETPMVYLCASAGAGTKMRAARGEEHWNWPANATVAVSCYSNCPEVLLTLNGRTIGTKRLAEALDGVLGWDVPYEPGVLKAVGRKNGQPVCEFALKTAGEPKRIELNADTTQLQADGKDICHVEFRIVDAQGVRVPNADPSLTFELDGPAEIIGIGNGDLNNIEDCKGRVHKAYQGRGLLILRSSEVSGRISLTVTAWGLETATLSLSSR
jgi:beta-galactosidase